MPWKPLTHRPPGWTPAKRVRRDGIDRAYGTQAWRKLAALVVARDRGICHICGQPGADTAHHLVAKRNGGADQPGQSPRRPSRLSQCCPSPQGDGGLTTRELR